MNLELYVGGYNIFLIVLIPLLSSVILTPIAKRIALYIGAIDKPDYKRKVHKHDMPRMGGVAIFFSFLIGYMIFAPKTTQMLSVLIGGFVIVLTGIFDDIKPLKAKHKLIAQIIAASIVVFYGNIVFSDMKIFGVQFEFQMIAYPLTLFFIIAIINAINLADGLDGLAAGNSSIYFFTIAFIGYIMNKLGGLDVILCLIMGGACLGFLFYNFAPASIYMGDSGSMFLGFIISIIALLGFKTATITSLIIPLLVLFVPILDTIFAMMRRVIKGKGISDADAEHLHHQLLKTTHSTRKSVILMYIINVLFAAVSVFYTLGDKHISIFLYVVLLLLVVGLVFKTDILFEHTHKKRKK